MNSQKHKADESVKRYKTHLVCDESVKYKVCLGQKVYQNERIDYKKTFRPIVRFTSVRIILKMQRNLDLELYQMDVKIAFLNGE